MFERPELLYLLLAMPLAVGPGLMAVRAGRRRRIGAIKTTTITENTASIQ